MGVVTDHPAVRTSRWTPWSLTLLLAGVVYPVSWIAGLSVFASSTAVRSTGAAVLADDAGHAGAVAAQFLLTEGLPGVILGLVAWQLGRMTKPPTRAVVTISGLLAAAVSMVQCGIGLWITAHLTGADVERIGAVSQVLNRMDGVKMLLLAMVAASTALTLRRHSIALPRWLGWLAVVTAAGLTVSGIGYLVLAGPLANAAWISLPLLLGFVTGAAFCGSVRARVPRRDTRGADGVPRPTRDSQSAAATWSPVRARSSSCGQESPHDRRR